MITRTFKLILLASLVVISFVPGLPLRITIPRVAAPTSFTLYGRLSTPNGWGFTSSTVTNPGPDMLVTPGASVTLSLFSGDGFAHIFCVDYESTPDFACNTATEPLSPSFNSPTTPVIFTFTVTSTPGNYTYYCTIHTTSMRGKLVVSSPLSGGVLVPVDKLILLTPYLGLSAIILASSLTAVSYTKRRKRIP